MLKFFKGLEEIKEEIKKEFIFNRNNYYGKNAIIVEEKGGFILYGEPIPSHQEHEISCRIIGAQIRFEKRRVFALTI